jgi:glycosyltransferase involved in cell wall biosynthesis
MSRFYEERYGEPARVIYPSRASNCPDFDAPPANNDKPFTIAFAGTINSDGYVEALTELQNALKPVGGRLLIFGPNQFGLDDPNTENCGLVSSSQLLTRLREEAHALFVPMSFDECDRGNMQMAFPSKLADYTATGLPLLIYGPSYCSAVVWARDNQGVAEVVENKADLNNAINRLANDPSHRLALGKRALDAGREYFTHNRAQQLFIRAIKSV